MRVTTFPPTTTERLVIRPLQKSDAQPLAAYRNDPDTARYQGWTLPYRLEWAEELVAEVVASPWPLYGGWFQLGIERDGDLVGDIGVNRSDDGNSAEIGYTLAPSTRGQGLATEAVGAVVDLLFSEGVHRVSASLDPANVASARVVERLGLRHEGLSIGSALTRGEWLDDDLYGITAGERKAWLGRRLSAPGTVGLDEITWENRDEVSALEPHRSQERFVASVLQSFGDALFPDPDRRGGETVPWMRVVLADGAPVAFVMLAQVTPTNPDPFLWRLLVDRWHQGRGIGRRVLALLANELLAAGHTRMGTSWRPGPVSPEGFYLRLGFIPTGEVIDGEIFAIADLTTLASR